MPQPTNLAQSIDIADTKAKYDECAKNILAYKSVIATILNGCVQEFESCDVNYIIENCLPGKAIVSQKAVHQDQPDRQVDGEYKIEASRSESSSIKEQTIYYDIRFNALKPHSKEQINLIINLEIQLNDKPSYHIVKRGLYYCGRMISEQYGTVFTNEDYEKLNKVFSIWICPTPNAKKRYNSIFRYHTIEDAIAGKSDTDREIYDLQEVIILNIGDEEEEKNIKILDFLNTIFSSSISAENKKIKLATKFGLAMTKDLESEVKRMCNLSDGIVMRERANGIKKMIHILKKVNIPDSEIINSIIEEYHLTRDEALTYMQS